MKHETITTTDCPCCDAGHVGCAGSHRLISWSAIFVGAIVGIGLTFLLNLFSLAIGLSSATTNSSGATVLALGGMLGIVIGLIASMLAAGYTAGYLGRVAYPGRHLGIIYGFATWTVALLLTAFIGAKMGSYVTAYSNAVANADYSVVQIKPATSTEPAKVEATKTTTNKTPVKTETTETTVQTTTTGLAWGALGLFGLFFLGAISCCIGAHCGMMGCRKDEVVEVHHKL
ncbi:MAG: hypothetical protein LCH30_06870 [Proteobacteria bacterium]|nr:hypothetical protein [Pseudomonadota bacterium]